jgi:hypothetical protein
MNSREPRHHPSPEPAELESADAFNQPLAAIANYTLSCIQYLRQKTSLVGGLGILTQESEVCRFA